jgi:cation:H+ antiporter
LILALAALIRPVRVDFGLVRREAPLMLAVSAAVYALAWTGVFPRWLGGAMLAGLALFVYATLRWAHTEPPTVESEFRKFGREQHLLERRHRLRQAGWIAAGLVLLIVGGDWLVDSAVVLARRFGVAENVIGATLVAVGTSLPELATSIVAAVRRHGDISVGNIVGSNIFNLLGVLGVAVAIRAVPVMPAVRDFEFPWMLGFAGATVLVLHTGRCVTRLEGAALLAGYAAFVALLLR